MKKLGRTAILAVLIVILSALLFVACDKGGSQSPSENDNNGNQEHQHTYSQKWDYNENYHWHEATCEHDSLTIDYGKHNFDNDVCTVCNYKREAKPKIFFSVDDEIYSSVETKGNEIIAMPSNPTKAGYDFIGWFWDKDTWKRPFTANSMLNEPLKSDMTVYAYFEKTHTHTFDDAWTSDNTYHWHKATCEHDLISDKDEHNFDSSRVCTICGYRDTALHGVELKTNTLSINGTNISGKVSNETTLFSFVDEISVADSATYTVSTDINGSHTIRTKTVNLAIGDNTFYILVENGKDIKLYTVSIRRRPIYTVTFDSKGGTAVEQQQVEEDGFAVEPNTTRIGYDFDKWDYDLSKPILKDETITASWSAIKYTITYLLDGGVNNSDNPLTYTIEDEITLFPPTKVGYTGRWNNDGKIEIGSTGNKTFTASYTINQYKVTVTPLIHNICSISDGGVYEYNTQVTINLTDLYLGYDFLGWYNGNSLLSTELSYTFDIPANDLRIVVKLVVKEEMQCFDFSSTTDTCKITSLKDNTITKAIVPDYVTSIGERAFSGRNRLTSVIIPNSVTSIGESAFSGCSSLTEVNWNATECTSSGSYDYPICKGCSNLTTVNIGNNVKIIPAYAFKECIGLKKIIIPDSVTSIGDYAFNGCTYLASVYITNIAKWCAISFEHIYSNPLYYAHDLYLNDELVIDLIIPDSVTSISDYAFAYCDDLTSVIIGSSVTSIGESAFSGCSSLTEVNWNATECTKAGISLSPIFSGCSNLTTVNVGNNVTIIPSCAFYGCSSLTSIMIPDSVSSIGSSAFSGCSSLTSITIPDSVTRIDDDVFSGCGLKNFIIPDSITDIGDSAFSGCTSLTSISIPDSVTNIGAFAFRFCYNLTNIEIPNTVNSIDSFAFERCGITSITIPESVCGVERSIFKGCSNLTTVNWDAIACRGAGSLQYLTFSDCSNLTTVNIGNNVTIIPSYIFAGCTGLTNITIPDSVTSIGNCAFYGCKGLINITIPDNVTSIGGYAFSGCSGLTTINWNATACTNAGSSDYPILGNCSKLTTINIGYNVTTIPAYAFYDCAGLTSIAIPNGVTNIGVCALGGCSSLKSITIPFVGKSNNATAYEAVLGYIFGYKTEILTGDYNWATTANESCSTSFYYSSASDVSGATWQYSCYNSYGEYYGLPYCWNDKKHSLTYTKNNGYRLQSYYFYIPASLKNVVVTGEKVSDYAFFNCKGLTSITISNSVSNIGVGAFKNCNSLTSITIPDSVTTIGDSAFEGCSGLTTVFYAGTENQWKTISISSDNSRLTNATHYYYSEIEPPLNADGTEYNGNYWRYDTDGVTIVIWKKSNGDE